MSWPTPNNGGQGSWTSKLVVGALAFALLVTIGYYNGRQSHPEIFDTEYVPKPGTIAQSDRPMRYPQIDMTEQLAKEAKEAKEAEKKAASPQPSPSAEPSASPSASPTAEASPSPEASPSTSPSSSPDATPDATPEATPTANALQDAEDVPDMVYDTSWPPPQNRPRTESTFLKRIPTMMFFLAIVCALIWVSLKIIAPLGGKLTGNAAKKKQINLIERQNLGPNKTLVLVEVADKRLLLGVTDKNINALAEFACPQEDEDTAAGDGTSSDSASSSPENKPKDLLKEVITKHLSALPSLKQP